jgi:hypothetical protein
LQKTADAGAKMIEVYRNVAQSTPQGAAVDQKLLKWMQEHQREMGIADLMANAVAGMDDEHAQMLAQKIFGGDGEGEVRAAPGAAGERSRGRRGFKDRTNRKGREAKAQRARAR